MAMSCANCGCELVERGCKVRCAHCGYFTRAEGLSEAGSANRERP